MSVQEIEIAITQLPIPELSQLAAWFEEYQADQWDRQIEADALGGASGCPGRRSRSRV